MRRCAIAFVLLLGIQPPAGWSQSQNTTQNQLLKNLGGVDRDALLRQLGQDAEYVDPETAARNEKEAERRDPGKGRTGDDKGMDPPRLNPHDDVLIEVRTVAAAANSEFDRNRLDEITKTIRSRNPYTLDSAGALQLPGLAPIGLGGLNEAQAGQRLTADPALYGLGFSVTLLPVTKLGVDGLTPFGYEIFDNPPSTFSPVTEIPAPVDYALGAGDQINVLLYGAQNKTLRLTVARDGRVSLPDIGPVSVGGKNFDAAAAEIESRVAKQMVGVQASVSLGDTRSIRIFVLGEAKKPGSYTVSGLATVMSALYSAGGVSLTGSLRNIQLKRNGMLVRKLDLYDLLLRGDSSNDAVLKSGDIIFVPPVGATVSVGGMVRRPAVYELSGPTNLGALVAQAGGLEPDADRRKGTLIRLNEDGRRVALDLDFFSGKSAEMKGGDRYYVHALRPTLDSGVRVDGHVFRPGTLAWRDGLRVSDVIPSIDELKPNADSSYVLVRRENPVDRQIEILSVDLRAALHSPRSEHDLQLEARDRVIVFDLDAGRRAAIDGLLSELRRQSSLDAPTQIVAIGGRVKFPGDYPLQRGMRVSDLIRAGGGLDDAAFAGNAEITRFERKKGERVSELLEVNLRSVLANDLSADVELQPFDALTIKETPEWSLFETVTLDGEIRFPGKYPIRRGETLRSVLERAGGLSSLAFSGGSFFTRKELAEREAEQLNQLMQRMQSQLVTNAIQVSQASATSSSAQAVVFAEGLLSQLRTSKPVGRLVIDLDRVIGGGVGSRSDVVLRDGDRLFVPKIRQEITVLGEVQNPTSHFFKTGLDAAAYINLSGGYSRKADRSRVYVVKANGEVSATAGGWFASYDAQQISPGDTIVVPVDIDKLPPLPFWQAVTTILYNFAVAVAAVGSL